MIFVKFAEKVTKKVKSNSLRSVRTWLSMNSMASYQKDLLPLIYRCTIAVGRSTPLSKLTANGMHIWYFSDLDKQLYTVIWQVTNRYV